LDSSVVHDLCERRHRADREAALLFGYAVELLDSAQVDHHCRAFDTVFEPVVRVEPASEDPRLAAVLIQQGQRVVHRVRLEELEGRNHISDDRHGSSP